MSAERLEITSRCKRLLPGYDRWWGFKLGCPQDFLSFTAFTCEKSASSLPAQLNSKNTAAINAHSSCYSQRFLRAA
jgi:hypothetical protein